MRMAVSIQPENKTQAHPYLFQHSTSIQDVTATIDALLSQQEPAPAEHCTSWQASCPSDHNLLTLTAPGRNSIKSLALVTFTLQFAPAGKALLKGTLSPEDSARSFLEMIRPLTRRTDVVFLLHTTCYFLLLGANVQGAKIVQERLWEALLWRIHNTTDGRIMRPHMLSMGYSAAPEPSLHGQHCILAASTPRISIDLRPEKELRQADIATGKETELSALARTCGVPYLALLPRKLPATLKHLINPRLARELRCYPLGRERDTLTVAISDPRDRSTLDRLQQETGLRIFPVLAPPHELQLALEQFVG